MEGIGNKLCGQLKQLSSDDGALARAHARARAGIMLHYSSQHRCLISHENHRTMATMKIIDSSSAEGSNLLIVNDRQSNSPTILLQQT
jgi:hypothetical protein